MSNLERLTFMSAKVNRPQQADGTWAPVYSQATLVGKVMVMWCMQDLTDRGLDSLTALSHLSALSLAGADGLNGSGLVALQHLSRLQVGKARAIMNMLRTGAMTTAIHPQ